MREFLAVLFPNIWLIAACITGILVLVGYNGFILAFTMVFIIGVIKDEIDRLHNMIMSLHIKEFNSRRNRNEA